MNSAVKSVTKSKWSHWECSTQHDTGLVKDDFFNNEVPESKLVKSRHNVSHFEVPDKNTLFWPLR